MRNLVLTLFTAAAAMTVTQAASAADLPRSRAVAAPVMAPVSTWTGCYIGANLGGAFGRADINAATGGGVSGTKSGFAGGAQFGCDYQFAGTGWVVGMRNMFDGTSFKSSGTIPGGTLAGATADSKTTWFHTLTGRVGYAALPDGLLYIHGGGAWAHFDQTITQAGVQVGQFSNTKGGYAVGGGWEYKFAPNWSAFVEYNYMDFGTSSGTTTNGVNVNLKRDMQTVLVGVNWRFGSPWSR
jgi:outer membrane immunogenic protein